ncbi:glutathione peroxidase [Bacillus sp. FJAT-44742]|uniref:glutathione peroxidase n=1 Tax=Bacillus sp. FJAT-44742 TaxID=2014005 RepID=UPI000C23E666|nr:glutathione peroxidase [Bacillus sp. FJAT-44742]
MSTLYTIDVKRADGTEKSLAEYKGDVLLIVNVASECGYTPQYEQLEEIYQQYHKKGFHVLGFPSNDFGGQEPGNIDQIQNFCQSNYGVSFEVFDKVHAKGGNKHPLYEWLIDKTDPDGGIDWNFEKFVISRDGEILGSFKSDVKPNDPQITGMIEAGLEQPVNK